MRGKVRLTVENMIAQRITPAYAGKSTLSTSLYICRRDHPRLCGEKVCLCHMKKESKGSPPPMRGKVAGGSVFASGTRDHPRLCGEKLKDRLVTAASKGSPPPMRGKACCVMPAFSRSRITPAYAGKSAQIEQAKFVLQDHPRLCGEKTTALQESRSLWGSPPPMRGKVDPFRHRCRQTGITPAYAGKSKALLLNFIDLKDHPRLCGEKLYLQVYL